MLARGRSRRQAGDTIVEVLIAIAIVSLILAGAYATANRSVRTLQDTAEHAQALKLVQSQVEFLRAKGKPTGSNKCFDITGASTNSCSLKADGAPAANGFFPQYNLSVTSGDSDSNCSADAYTIDANWDNLFGAQDDVSVCYRLGDNS